MRLLLIILATLLPGHARGTSTRERSTRTTISDKVQFVVGDITKQAVDVIVNSTTPTLDLSNGPLSRNILKAGGDILQAECRSNYPHGISKTQVAITSGGFLCKQVYHTTSSDWGRGHQTEQELRDLIQTVLQTADSSGMSSIAIPAIGTGTLQYPPDVVARCIVETANRFQPHSLSKILLVVLGSDKQIIKVAVIVNSTSPDLQLSSGPVSKAILKAGGNRIQEECKYKYPNGIKVGWIAETSGGKLKCQAIYHTALTPWTGDPQVEQLYRSVITSCLKKASESGKRSIAFPVLGAGNLQYPLDMVAKCVFESFDRFSYDHPSTSLAEARIVIHPNDERNLKYFRAFKGATSSSPVGTGGSKHGTAPLPNHWSPMKPSALVARIRLSPKDREYDEVVKKFLNEAGRSHKVVRVERIQNRSLYAQYLLQKNKISSANPSIKVDRHLWHGTAADAITSIDLHGFSRSYTGKNATRYGEGTYFAVNAGYSTSATYSSADTSGHRRIYLVDVLTGSYTKGKSGMRVPPHKDKNNPHILYDTVVDDVSNPSMFVVFNDVQAYPLYLVTFK